jgi:hypothetical protein
MIRSGKPIEKDTVGFVAANKLRKPGDVIPALNDDELKALTRELDELQKLHGAGTLVDDPAKNAIVVSITKELDTSGLLYKKLRKSYMEVVLEEKGMIAKMKKATRLNAIRGRADGCL